MNKSSFFDKFKFWILKTLQIQFFLTIISLPILINWGLPVSLASTIGNIIFAPILTIFLFISSLIFFFELLGFSNDLLIYFLDQITSLWYKLLSLGSTKWLLTFPRASYLILILFPLIALLVLQHKKLNNLRNSTICFALILLFAGIYLKTLNITDTLETLENNNKKIIINYKDKKINLIDHGALGRSSSPNSWLEYNLIPHLIKKFGHSEINKIEISNINFRTIKAVECLSQKTKINKIVFNKHFYNINEFLIKYKE